MNKRIAAAVLFVAILAAALGPIRSYDAFWHFAAGHWIVAHHALPQTDPLAVASAKVPWINGEWLWQVIAFAVVQAAGLAGASWLTAVTIATAFTLAFWFTAREQDPGVALVLAAVAFAGASDRLGVRPLTAAALLVVVAIALLAQTKMTATGLAVAYALVTVLWINTHPSALLAPLLALATLLIDVRRWRVAAASAVALLANPFGWHAVVEPFRLSALAGGSAEFVNAEWQVSPPAIFPLLYTSVVVAVIWFLVTPEKRAHAWRFILFAGFAFLAIRYVRNQALYFAALPLLLPPLRKVPRSVSMGFAIAAVVPLVWVMQAQDHTTGVDGERFPVRSVARLAASGLAGNIYNVDQFGGFLEWAFYPERRVLTDGRNELFASFISEDFEARSNSRSWSALLKKYRVDLAVEEYSGRSIEVVDAVTGERKSLPQSVVRYRQREWALIAFDDAAMIFARRAAFPPRQIAALEYLTLVPDAPGFGLVNPRLKALAQQEVARAKRDMGDLRIIQDLEEATK
jgi:hypothetical protein